MHANTARRMLVAAGALAALAVSGTALAAFPNSGGPGALGTQVPFDSRLAREYFSYYLPTDTPEALRIRDEVQQLHAGHQAAVELGKVAATSQDPEVRQLAARVAEEQGLIDWTLVEVCKDSLLDLAGTSYAAAVQPDAAAIREVQAASGPDRDARLVSSVVSLLERQTALVDGLRPQAKKALRQQLGSVLDREHKLLASELTSARALSAKVAARGSGEG